MIGGGVIGLSLAWQLKRNGVSTLLVEKSEPAREATYAAGGMIAHCDPHAAHEVRALVAASAKMYSEFVHEVQDESGESVDLRDAGTILFLEGEGVPADCFAARKLGDDELTALEPLVNFRGTARWLPESSVDPRALGSALVNAAKHRGVDFVTGAAVSEVLVEHGRAAGVRTAKAVYGAGAVVNCAGAWAGQLQPFGVPTLPVKGQMLCVVPLAGTRQDGPALQHVVRAPEVYLVPRSDGRLLVGATVEDAGFDKRVDAHTIQRLHQAAANVVPAIGDMRIHDAWAGLRPGTPDGLPVLGETAMPGYYAATGHYRDGILLAPITAKVIADLLTGKAGDLDLTAFSPLRFG